MRFCAACLTAIDVYVCVCVCVCIHHGHICDHAIVQLCSHIFI